MSPLPEQFRKIIMARTSCRKYDATREVPEEALNACLEAVRMAPSACNRQPWRIIIVRDARLREEICAEGLLPGIPMPWLRDAPVIAVLCTARQMVVHKIIPLFSGINYDLIDCGIAGEHFVLAAEAQGLGTCWIGWFKAKKIRKLLGIPGNVEPLSLISLGYPAAITPPRSRLPMEEIVRADRWETPYTGKGPA